MDKEIIYADKNLGALSYIKFIFRLKKIRQSYQKWTPILLYFLSLLS